MIIIYYRQDGREVGKRGVFFFVSREGMILCNGVEWAAILQTNNTDVPFGENSTFEKVTILFKIMWMLPIFMGKSKIISSNESILKLIADSPIETNECPLHHVH